ncbi:MAG: F0F1 ATP synthase subunit alpha, partial [Cyanobacteria bacterium P01_H01_bin.121]
AAQTKAIKKVAGKMKLELAQFDELAAFAQFASDLDKATQNQLARGERLREVLKQPQYSPLTLPEQVAVVYAGVNGLLDDLPKDKVTDFVKTLRDYLNTSQQKYMELIRTQKKLEPESEELLKAAIAECKKTLMATA